jgi:hypothetical protein
MMRMTMDDKYNEFKQLYEKIVHLKKEEIKWRE